MEHPKYLLYALICSISLSILLWIIYPNWSREAYYIIAISSFSGFALIFTQILRYRTETKLEEDYESVLNVPFEQKFIIPPINIYKLNYEKQNNDVQRKDTINIPANTKAVIIIRTRIREELDFNLEVMDSQYNFGGGNGKKAPEIIQYKNPYFKKRTILTKWFEKELGEDWWGLYHLSGKRLIFKNVIYTDGFEIETHDKGEFLFDMHFIVTCKKYKKLEKEKTKEINLNLKVNVI